MTELIQHLINGVSLGSIYALLALGYTLVFGVLRLINFAHGDVFMVGAFVAYYFARAFGLDAQPSFAGLVVTILCSMGACALLGLAIERLAYRPLRNAPRINTLITAVGVSMLLQFSGQLLFGADPKFFPQIYQPQANWAIGGLTIQPLQIMVLGSSLVLMALLQFIVFKTRLGRAMRAASFSHELTGLMGIPTAWVISGTFMLGSALAGAAAVMVGLTYPKIDPLMGALPGLKAFVAAVLGGIGNVTGAVVGALLLGLAEEMLVGYWAPTYRDALAFALLIGVLIIKPTGLFGSQRTEKV